MDVVISRRRRLTSSEAFAERRVRQSLALMDEGISADDRAVVESLLRNDEAELAWDWLLSLALDDAPATSRRVFDYLEEARKAFAGHG